MIDNAERFDECGSLTEQLAEERVHQPASQESGQFAATDESQIKDECYLLWRFT
jgi:hypothetical protein